MTEQENELKARTSRQRRLPVTETPLATPDVSIPPEAQPAPLPFVEEIEPALEPMLETSGLRPHDVVQVIDPTSRLYGAFFAVGDVRNGKVHGYYMTEGRSKQFITLALNMVHPITNGAKVRSANPCSPKWLSDNQ